MARYDDDPDVKWLKKIFGSQIVEELMEEEGLTAEEIHSFRHCPFDEERFSEKLRYLVGREEAERMIREAYREVKEFIEQPHVSREEHEKWLEETLTSPLGLVGLKQLFEEMFETHQPIGPAEEKLQGLKDIYASSPELMDEWDENRAREKKTKSMVVN